MVALAVTSTDAREMLTLLTPGTLIGSHVTTHLGEIHMVIACSTQLFPGSWCMLDVMTVASERVFHFTMESQEFLRCWRVIR